MNADVVPFAGYDCVRLDGDATTMLLSTSVGPRILGLIGEGDNVLAIVPDAGVDRPDGGRYRFLGGHRLWAAPEDPETTYRSDERPCDVTEVDGGIRVQAPPDGAGLVKTIEVKVTSEPAGWIVDHELANAGERPITAAPWAITQLRPGGEAIIPNAARGTGPQADRCVVLWPYTDAGDDRVAIDAETVRVRATSGPPLKLGVAPSDGRVRYRLDGEVFEKQAELDVRGRYPDRGAAVQVYLCDAFCELETLGTLREIDPGTAATHRERWTLRSEA